MEIKYFIADAPMKTVSESFIRMRPVNVDLLSTGRRLDRIEIARIAFEYDCHTLFSKDKKAGIGVFNYENYGEKLKLYVDGKFIGAYSATLDWVPDFDITETPNVD